MLQWKWYRGSEKIIKGVKTNLCELKQKTKRVGSHLILRRKFPTGK